MTSPFLINAPGGTYKPPGLQGIDASSAQRTSATREPMQVAREESPAQSPQANNISPEDLRNATQRLNAFVEPVASDISFSIDEDTGSRIVKVIDRATKDVIRQIPSEEILNIAKALDQLQGLIIRQKA